MVCHLSVVLGRVFSSTVVNVAASEAYRCTAVYHRGALWHSGEGFNWLSSSSSSILLALPSKR
jgi:hypothetical protein